MVSPEIGFSDLYILDLADFIKIVSFGGYFVTLCNFLFLCCNFLTERTVQPRSYIGAQGMVLLKMKVGVM